ncbi:CRISPR-associated endonuclease Cas2 [Pelotomaculum propionicicum]|jgi:CRISPR-associated protein Cas2
MWMIVLFDLPVMTKKERKAASQFRTGLLNKGFHMSQFSVYYRLISGREAFDSYVADIKKNLPKAGKVDIVSITDRQYEDIVSFSGKKREKSKQNPTQLVLF